MCQRSPLTFSSSSGFMIKLLFDENRMHANEMDERWMMKIIRPLLNFTHRLQVVP